MSDLSSVETCTAVEIASVLKTESDKAKQVYKEAVAEGDTEAAGAAWNRYSRVDDKRLQFNRCLESVKEVLAATL
jgi:hypothetical protein